VVVCSRQWPQGFPPPPRQQRRSFHASGLDPEEFCWRDVVWPLVDGRLERCRAPTRTCGRRTASCRAMRRAVRHAEERPRALRKTGGPRRGCGRPSKRTTEHIARAGNSGGGHDVRQKKPGAQSRQLGRSRADGKTARQRGEPAENRPPKAPTGPSRRKGGNGGARGRRAGLPKQQSEKPGKARGGKRGHRAHTPTHEAGAGVSRETGVSKSK